MCPPLTLVPIVAAVDLVVGSLKKSPVLRAGRLLRDEPFPLRSLVAVGKLKIKWKASSVLSLSSQINNSNNKHPNAVIPLPILG